MIQKLALLLIAFNATQASANRMPKCNVAADQTAREKFGDLVSAIESNDCVKAWNGRGPTEMVCTLAATSANQVQNKFLIVFSDESCEVVFTALHLER